MSTETSASFPNSMQDSNTDKPMNFEQTKAAKKEHDQIVAWALSQYQAIRNARNATERQWYLNLAFFFGKQNVQLLKPELVNSGANIATRLHIPRAPYWRARPVINKVRPTIRTELAHLTSNRPNASVVPASAEDRDMYAAMAGEQVWEHYYTDKKLKSIIRRCMWWTLVCGNGFIKCYWDFSKGVQEKQKDGTLAPPPGDICYTQETPFHVLCPDLREEELENQPFLIHAQVKSVDWAKMHFKVALDGTPMTFSGTTAAQDLLEDSFLNLTGIQSLHKQHSVLILEFWIKPNMHPKFPEGAFFTVVGDKIVQGQQGWPFSHGQFPFAKFDHIPSGKFYSTSVIEDLIPLQKEYNRTRGQIIEAKNRTAKPQIMAPRGSVDPSKITSEPGQVILYTPGFNPPTPLPMQSLPGYVTDELVRIKEDWDDISGQHEVSKGQVPPGVTAATAISFLQERDESKMSPTFDSLEEGIEKIATMTLSYVNEYWDTPRVVKITGPDGSFDAQALKGSDIDGNTDIRIEAGSSLPVSKAAKQALIMDLMKMGFIDPQKGLEVMDMGGINKIYEQIQTDQRQVQRENMRMSKVTDEIMQEFEQSVMQQQLQEQMQMQMQQPSVDPMIDPMADPLMQGPDPMAVDPMAMGALSVIAPPPLIVPVNTWDNHKLHIEMHNQYRKGQAFEVLSPTAKKLFEEHVKSHVISMGIETVTMDPRTAAGLPPDPNAEEDSSEQSSPTEQQPGPEPMPTGMMG